MLNADSLLFDSFMIMHMVARPVVVVHILTRCNDAVVMLEHGTRHIDGQQ